MIAQTYDNGVMGSLLDRDVFETAYLLGSSSTPSKPEVAATDRGNLAIAWRSGLEARARVKPYRQAFAGDAVVSNPALGPVDDPGVYVGGDRVGDFAVAMVQGTEGARALTISVFDDPPNSPYIGTAGADICFPIRPQPSPHRHPELAALAQGTLAAWAHARGPG